MGLARVATGLAFVTLLELKNHQDGLEELTRVVTLILELHYELPK